jgi:hypothetical protein
MTTFLFRYVLRKELYRDCNIFLSTERLLNKPRIWVKVCVLNLYRCKKKFSLRCYCLCKAFKTKERRVLSGRDIRCEGLLSEGLTLIFFKSVYRGRHITTYVKCLLLLCCHRSWYRIPAVWPICLFSPFYDV